MHEHGSNIEECNNVQTALEGSCIFDDCYLEENALHKEIIQKTYNRFPLMAIIVREIFFYLLKYALSCMKIYKFM
jgi:hypothetical protein